MNERGIYLLTIRVGARTDLTFAGQSRALDSGWYMYCGSAMGGLRPRLARHLRREKRNHWHIDSLLEIGRIVDIQLAADSDKSGECRTARFVCGWPEAKSVPGFGAGDCRCRCHLFQFSRRPALSLHAPRLLPLLPAIFGELRKTYDNHALRERDPFMALVKCILSLRTQDPVTDAAADRLFEAMRTPQELRLADPDDIARRIYPVGMYRQKARTLIAIANAVLEQFDGVTPAELDELTTLPGVGRKTANLVRSFAFHLPAVCVDTHVHRITNRWGLVRTATPGETEDALRNLLPEEHWIELNPFLVQHGQQVCRPLRPRCAVCGLRAFCGYDRLKQEALLLGAIAGAPHHPSLTFG